MTAARHPLAAFLEALGQALEAELDRQDGCRVDLAPLGKRRRGVSRLVQKKRRQADQTAPTRGRRWAA